MYREDKSRLIFCYFLALLLIIAAKKMTLDDSRKIIKDKADILIGGGSLAALATAITAANLSKSLSNQKYQKRENNFKIVLIEPTDWAGGQLTASNVPPDFGAENFNINNLPRSFVDLLLAVAGPEWSSNPGQCWVSYKCFEAPIAVDYIKNLTDSLYPYLQVYFNSVVKDVDIDSSSQTINKVNIIRRIPTSSVSRRSQLSNQSENLAPWTRTLSEEIHDWYSPIESDYFSKEEIEFEDIKVVVEATEFSDILMLTSSILANMTEERNNAKDFVSQGVEFPYESSDQNDDSCGQSIVYPFYMNLHEEAVDGSTGVPLGSDNGIPFTTGDLTWSDVWTYRRSLSKAIDYTYVEFGDSSNQNLDNDYAAGYLFNSISEAMEEISSQSGWQGGLNLTSLANAEQRSYAWYHYLLNISNSTIQGHLILNSSLSGTVHGLSKVPYLRDTRRVKYGIDDFRLLYADLNYSNPEDNGQTAKHFYDTVAIGVYHYADIHGLKGEACRNGYPSYVTCCSHPVNPYYIPFRAITHANITNLLVPGKGMAQSFLANAATRLHPTEWSTGVAAGAAAFLMTTNSSLTSTRAILADIQRLQDLLQSDKVESPLRWTLQ